MADEAPILIVGAGPVGMLLAYQLDRMNVPCVIAEQNVDTTKWPKMDLTNCRSMELLRYLGLADDYRAQPGTVPDGTGFDTLFVTNLNPTGRLLSSWVWQSCDLAVIDAFAPNSRMKYPETAIGPGTTGADPR